MLVQRVAPAGSRVDSWTVLGEDDRAVEAIERYVGRPDQQAVQDEILTITLTQPPIELGITH